MQTPGSPNLHNRDQVATISNLAPQASNILYVQVRRCKRQPGIFERLQITGVPEPSDDVAAGQRASAWPSVSDDAKKFVSEEHHVYLRPVFGFFDWLRWTPMNVIHCFKRRACLVSAFALLVGQAISAHAQTVLIDFGR